MWCWLCPLSGYEVGLDSSELIKDLIVLGTTPFSLQVDKTVVTTFLWGQKKMAEYFYQFVLLERLNRNAWV